MPFFASHASRVLAAASVVGDEALLADDQRTLSGTQFVAEVQRLARVIAGLGYGPGHRVGIAAGVTIRAVAVRQAAALVGCATAFSPEAGDRLTHFVSLVRPDLMVVGPGLADLVPVGVCGRVIGPGSPGLLDLETDPVQPGASTVLDGPDPGDLGVLVSSGGTTGRPKASERSFAAYLGLVDGPPDPSRRQLVCTPLAYVAQVLLDQTLIGGGRAVLQDHFEPAAVLEAVESSRITHLGLVEPLLARLVDHPDRPRRNLSSLASVTHIGACAPASLRRRWLEALGPVLANPYGSSECGIATALTAPEYGLEDAGLGSDRRLASSGRPLPRAQVRIEGSDGRPADTGVCGRVIVRTAGSASGYVGQDAPPAFRPDGWFASEDLGIVDADGYLTIRGRSADERFVDGRSVLPLDVEAALCTHPHVRYAAAVPLARGSRPFGAVVTVAAPCGPEELSAWVEDRDPVLVPSVLTVVGEIPVTEQGKPNRESITAVLRAARGRDA